MDKPQYYWDEFDWERFFRRKERFVRAYVELLDRFAELPDGEDLILNELTRRFGAAEVEAMYTYDEEGDDLLPDGDDLSDPNDDGLDQDGQPPPPDFPPDEDDGWKDSPAEDDAFAERYQRLRQMEEQFRSIMVIMEQTTQGWCNMMSSVLPTALRGKALRVLFILSRTAMNLNSCAGEMAAARKTAVISLSKRVLADLNDAVGQVANLREQTPHLNEILGSISERLVTAADEVADFICSCRELPGESDDDDIPF